jgi:transcriptional regulator with XRE-family HTH domain
LARKELAERARISYSYLSSIEAGQKLPSESVLSTLARALELSPADLLARANDMILSESSQRYGESESSRDRFGTPEVASLRTPESEPPALEASPSDLSASGAAAEIDALLPELSSEDRATLLTVARRLRSQSRGAREDSSVPLGTIPRESRSGRRTALYVQFWKKYLRELRRRGLGWADVRSPEPRSYFTTPSPLKGTSLTASFARNRMLRHELYINRGSREANLDFLRALLEQRETLERAYGRPLEFEDPGEERRAVRIAEYRKGHISREDEHDDYVAWFVDRGERMRKALEVVGPVLD